MSAADKKQPIVVFVGMAKKRLVIPVRDPSAKVFELGALIAARFRVERVAELRTNGFLLDGNDTIEEVIRDGSSIECLDYTGWMDTNNQDITNNRNANWCELENADFLDDKIKWIRCGWAQNLGKFFIKMGGERGWAPMQLDMFEPADLMSIAKKGKYVVSQIGDEKTGWFASAEFTAGENGAVDTVILRCKSKSDKREAIKSIKITVIPGADKPVVAGEQKVIQVAELPEETGVVYTLPADEVKGPSYPEVEEAKVDPKTPKPDPPEIKGEGSLPLLITCKMKPEIDRGYQRNIGDRWDMNINLECEFLNRGEQSLILTKWGAEYKTKEGKWETLKLTRGQRQGFYNYRWENASAAKDSIPIYGKTPQRYALGVSIPIDAPQLSRPRALHGSLPNPLEMKYTVADVNGGSVSIVIPISSTPEDMDLPTLSKVIKNDGHGKSVLGYIQADDTVAEGRIAATVFRKAKDDGDDEFEIRQNLTNSYQTYSLTNWKRIGFQQAAKGVSEFKLENACYESSGCTMDSFALIDIPRRKVYAVKISLKTGTSSATKTFLLHPPVAAATPVAST